MTLLRLASPLIAGRAASALLSFTVPLLLARRLPPAEYGTYKQFFLVATTATLVGQLGLPGSLYYFMPRSGGERGRYSLQTLALLFVAGVLWGAAILAGIGELAHRFENPRLVALGPPLALYALASLGATPLEIALTAQRRTGWAAVSYVTSDLARMAALVAPILGGHGLAALAWSAATFAGLRLGVTWGVALAGGFGPPSRPTRQSLGAQLRYALPFAGAVLLGVAQAQLPQYLVAALTDPALFAVFAVGALQIPFTDTVYTPIAEVMMVRLAESPRREAPRIFREAVARLAIFFLPLCAFAWAMAPVLIPTLYTERYRAAVPIFAIAAGEALLSAFPVDGLLRALAATRALLLANLVRIALGWIAVPTGLHLFGLAGAMAAHVGVQGFGKALLILLAARRLGVAPTTLLPGRILLGWATRAGAIFAAVSLVRALGPPAGWPLLVAGAGVGLAAWGALLLSAGELRRRRGTPAPAATSEEATIG